MMRRIAVLLALLCVVWIAQAQGGLDLYFVRHAETVKNASGDDNSGNDNTFSAKGIQQVDELTVRLKPLHFDAILVSSAPRALNTILPYLKATGQKAEIWPELAECCWQHDRGDSSSGKLLTGSAIELSPEQTPYFTLRDADSTHNYRHDTYADGVAQVHHAEQLLKQRYFGSGKTILIVGHYHSGRLLLADLLSVPRYYMPDLKNARLTQLRQDEDGHFTLLQINGKEASD